jgi:hypothetical protein
MCSRLSDVADTAFRYPQADRLHWDGDQTFGRADLDAEPAERLIGPWRRLW